MGIIKSAPRRPITFPYRLAHIVGLGAQDSLLEFPQVQSIEIGTAVKRTLSSMLPPYRHMGGLMYGTYHEGENGILLHIQQLIDPGSLVWRATHDHTQTPYAFSQEYLLGYDAAIQRLSPDLQLCGVWAYPRQLDDAEYRQLVLTGFQQGLVTASMPLLLAEIEDGCLKVNLVTVDQEGQAFVPDPNSAASEPYLKMIKESRLGKATSRKGTR